MSLPKRGLTIKDIIPLIMKEKEVEVLWENGNEKVMDILMVAGHTITMIEDAELKSLGCGEGRIQLQLIKK